MVYKAVNYRMRIIELYVYYAVRLFDGGIDEIKNKF